MLKYTVVALGLLIAVFVLAAFSSKTGPARARQLNIRNWLCYYGNQMGAEVYSKFDLVVLDSTYHPPLGSRDNDGPVILGYASVCEVIESGHLWPLVRDKSFLVKKNRFWNSWIVDVTDPVWQQLLFETVLPSIVEKGFDGFFLDTFDSALGLASEKDGPKFTEIKTALAQITRKIKNKYPNKLLAVNRGLPVLLSVAEHLDFVVVEGLYSYYSAADKIYTKVNSYTQNLLLQQLAQGLGAKPDLTVLTLDYAASNQTDLAKDAIFFSKKRGFIPYVSTYKLHEVFFYTLED